MTTPERFRRRQQLGGIAVFIVGLLVVISTIYGEHQRNVQADEFRQAGEAQRNCLIEQISAITDAFTARGDLSQQDSDATRTVIMAVARAETGDEVYAALRAYVDTQEAIASTRKEHPVPPFPTGACE